jgi:hypothetical protein
MTQNLDDFIYVVILANFGQTLNCFSFNFLTRPWPVQIVLFLTIGQLDNLNRPGSES